MSEKPILFSGPMVKALLDGKTQTRRVLTPQPDHHHSGKLITFKGGCTFGVVIGGSTKLNWKCQYGQPGDRLWVRETFAFKKGADVRERHVGTDLDETLGEMPHYAYRATEPQWGEFTEGSMKGKRCFKWRPSIFMPRKASRITLEITDVRVERLQEISREDVRAEGIPETYGEWGAIRFPGFESHIWDNMRFNEQFKMCWDQLNAKRGYSWDSNPWVWCISFKLEAPQ